MCLCTDMPRLSRQSGDHGSRLRQSPFGTSDEGGSRYLVIHVSAGRKVLPGYQQSCGHIKLGRGVMLAVSASECVPRRSSGGLCHGLGRAPSVWGTTCIVRKRGPDYMEIQALWSFV